MASTFGIGLNIRRKIFVSYHHGGDRLAAATAFLSQLGQF